MHAIANRDKLHTYTIILVLSQDVYVVHVQTELCTPIQKGFYKNK